MEAEDILRLHAVAKLKLHKSQSNVILKLHWRHTKILGLECLKAVNFKGWNDSLVNTSSINQSFAKSTLAISRLSTCTCPPSLNYTFLPRLVYSLDTERSFSLKSLLNEIFITGILKNLFPFSPWVKLKFHLAKIYFYNFGLIFEILRKIYAIKYSVIYMRVTNQRLN